METFRKKQTYVGVNSRVLSENTFRVHWFILSTKVLED